MSKTWAERRRWLWLTFLKLSFIFVILLIAAGVYLDAQIKQKFEGTKWQLPALVYGIEHNYQKSDALSRDALIRHLTLLDYRQVQRLTAPGEYRPVTNGVEFFRRAYSLPDKEIETQQVSVSFRKNRIARISDLKQAEPLTGFSLEPYLIDRLQANNLEDRILVNLYDVPDLFIQTLILVEDQKFYQHHGVSPLAILRALMVNLKAGRTVQGGSTLTQQLVKNMFLTNERSLWRKIKEAYLAVLLDARYTKYEILQAYLNEVYLGQNHSRSVNGLGLASHYYFAKPANELTPSEIALLVGMIKGPSYYNPRKYPERALARRDLILRLMTERSLISPEDYQYEISRSLSIQDESAIAKRRYPAYIDQVQHELKTILSQDIQLHSGLKIFTHFDPLAQNQAQAAISTGLSQLESQRGLKELQAASVIVDSYSGGIQAIVGDRQAHFDGFNRALNAQRNIGSLVKPAIYLTALQRSDFNLATILKDEPITLKSSLENQWSPQNYDKTYKGDILLIDALVDSRNVPAVNLGMSLGLSEVAQTLFNLGLTQDINQYPSMLLGSITMSPIQVSQIYQPLANSGMKQNIHAIRSVNAMDNQKLWSYSKPSQGVVTFADAYLLNYALNQVTRTGTAKWLNTQFPKIQFAGKTGTTNDLRDSWFVGYDQTQLAVFWIGHDGNEPTKLTGSSGALRLFSAYQHMRTPTSLVMSKPTDIEMRYFDSYTGEHLLPGCPNLRMLPAKTTNLSPAGECEQSKQWKKPEKTWIERLFSW